MADTSTMPTPTIAKAGGLPVLSHSHFMQKLKEENRFEKNRFTVAKRLERFQLTLSDEENADSQINLESTLGYVPYHEDLLPRWNAFADSQKDNESITSITVRNSCIPPSPFFKDKIYPIFQKNKNITSLELQGVNRSLIFGVISVLKMKKCCKLVSLDLSWNKTRFTDIARYQSLSEAIGNHPSLAYVNFSNNALGENVDHLSLVLKGSDKLESLILDSNDIDSDGVDLIMKFLKSNKTLTTLSLSDNDFGNKGVKAFASTFEENDDMALRELNLSKNGLTLATKVESKVLSDMLMHIDLSHNLIGVQGLKNVVAYLAGNPPLACMNLAGNILRNNVAALLMGALKRNTNLAHLNLGHNSFTKASVPCMVDALKNNSTLLTLDLTDNKIKPKSGGRKELVKNALFDSTTLQSIIDSNHSCQVYLSDNNWGNKDTHEVEIRKMNAFGNKGKTIRYKLVLAMFTLKTIPFNPLAFQHISLELMPRLLEFVQQEMGHKGFGKDVWNASRKGKGGKCLTRVYEVVTGWSMLPSLFERGPDKVKKKKKKQATKKRKRDDGKECIPGKRGK
eukprot:scaffold16520_cov151-Skeletonema_marinoi.AAC.2